jgi:cob(I)alamin adenosyltransferase
MPINLNELQSLLNKAEANTANEKEIRKGLTRIENLLTTIGQEVEKVYSLLDGATPVKKERRATNADAEAPFGRKADGTPKKRPGRVKAETAA